MEKKSENTCVIERNGRKSNKERLATRELVNALEGRLQNMETMLTTLIQQFQCILDQENNNIQQKANLQRQPNNPRGSDRGPRN